MQAQVQEGGYFIAGLTHCMMKSTIRAPTRAEFWILRLPIVHIGCLPLRLVTLQLEGYKVLGLTEM